MQGWKQDGVKVRRHLAVDPPAVADGRVLLQCGAQGGDLLGQHLQLLPLPARKGQ